MIDTDAKLAEFLPRLREAEWIAVDTEADSLHAYPEKVCLIQISIAGADKLVDPLSQIDLAPLWIELTNRELIFNAADYDLRLLRKKHGFVPSRIFDTMLAARLLGEKQFGLNNLVSKFLGIHLEKGSQTANWGRRPLSEKMENYARNDTRYLKPLADILRERLVEKSRLAWHAESCDRLIQDCSAIPPSDGEPWRIRGSNRLGRAALAVLRELWHWREKEALTGNKPPYFVLPHEMLLDMAESAAGTKRVLDSFPRHISARQKKGLQEAIERGLTVAPEHQPHVQHVFSTRSTQAEHRRFQELQKRRDRAAHLLHLDATLIASRATLGLLAHDWEKHGKELMNWQRELLTNS